MVKSALNLVTSSIPFGGVLSSFWGSSTTNTTSNQPSSSDEEDSDDSGYSNRSNSKRKANRKRNTARSAAQESIRKLPGTRYKIQCTLSDPNRRIDQVIVSPLRRYAALIDSYGRISILDCQTCSVIRMFKV